MLNMAFYYLARRPKPIYLAGRFGRWCHFCWLSVALWVCSATLLNPKGYAAVYAPKNAYTYAASMAQSSDPKAEKAQAERQLKQLQKEIQATRKRVERGQKNLSNAENKVRQIEQQIAQTTQQIHTTAEQLKALELHIEKLKKEQNTLQLKRTQQANLLSDQIEAAYRSGDYSFLKLLLSQNNPAQLERQLIYFKALNEARLIQLQALQATERELNQVKAQIHQEQQQVMDQQAQQKTQQAQLKAQQKQQKQEVAALAASQQKTQDILASQIESERALTELLDELAKVLAKQPIQLNGLSKLRAQLPRPVAGSIKFNYGERRSSQMTWRGVIFEEKAESPVRSIADGRVVFADWLRGYGLVVVLDHGDHYMSLYGYNQSLLYEVGQSIKQGQVIAYVGQSGGQKEPSLYFEIRHKGEPVNPNLYFKKQ